MTPPEDTGRIRCICGYDTDDGFTIQCENCLVWQHASCVGIQRPKDVPDIYRCEECQPRPLDKIRARLHQQQRKRGNISGFDMGIYESIDKIVGKRAIVNAMTQLLERWRLGNSANSGEQKAVEHIHVEGIFEKVSKDFILPWTNSLIEQKVTCRKQKTKPPGVSASLHGSNHSLSSGIQGHTSASNLTSNMTRSPQIKSLMRYSIHAATLLDRLTVIGQVTGQLRTVARLLETAKQCTLWEIIQPLGFLLPPWLSLWLDARQQGNMLRYVRRSCRPNAELVCLIQDKDSSFQWGWFIRTIQTLKEGDEITLPFEHYFPWYCECACHSGTEFCLAKGPRVRLVGATPFLNEQMFGEGKHRHRSKKQKKSTQSRPLSRPSSDHETGPQQNSKSETNAAATASSAHDDILAEKEKRKLSREERKIRAYIETIERLSGKLGRKRGAAMAAVASSSTHRPSPKKERKEKETVAVSTPVKDAPRTPLKEKEFKEKEFKEKDFKEKELTPTKDRDQRVATPPLLEKQLKELPASTIQTPIPTPILVSPTVPVPPPVTISVAVAPVDAETAPAVVTPTPTTAKMSFQEYMAQLAQRRQKEGSGAAGDATQNS